MSDEAEDREHLADADSVASDRIAADARAAAFGRIIALLMASPQHAGLTLSETQAFVGPALALGQIAIFGRSSAASNQPDVAAAVWWALVSAEVDARLTQSQDKHLILAQSEWRSGTQPWIIASVGNSDVVNELIKRVVEHAFAGQPAKIRAHLADGRIAVGRIERRPANPASPKS